MIKIIIKYLIASCKPCKRPKKVFFVLHVLLKYKPYISRYDSMFRYIKLYLYKSYDHKLKSSCGSISHFGVLFCYCYSLGIIKYYPEIRNIVNKLK